MDQKSASLEYSTPGPTWSTSYLWPVVQDVAKDVLSRHPARAFDLGCGNGYVSNLLAEMGFSVTGIDVSETGIAIASRAFPNCKFELGSAYDELAGKYGSFPLVVSLEVIEHCYYPRKYLKSVLDLLAPGGTAVISTPYHGYLKNVALAAAGKMDFHFNVLADGGHIKFFSVETLGAMMREVGFSHFQFRRVGRVPALAKSMIAIARKPTA